MSNGPMGGFMPTPAAPSQPPPVKLDTTATSRGNFTNFLKSMNGASALTPLAPSGMGAIMPQMAPSPMSDIDIFNEPVQMMHQGGAAGNPLDSYGDFLSNQISNTQVEPFIQEVQQMASQRFNLGSGSGGSPQPGIFEPPQEMTEPAEIKPSIDFEPFNPFPSLSLRDKDGILRPGNTFQPVNRSDGPGGDIFDPSRFERAQNPGIESVLRNPVQVPRIPSALDMQKELTGFMDFERGDINGIPAFDPRFAQQLRTFDDGGEVQNFFSGGEIDSFVDEQDSSNNDDDDDGFSFDDDVADYQTDDSGIFTGTGDDNQSQSPTVNFTNQTIENAFDNLNIPEKTRKELRDDLQDRAKDNDLIGALDAAQKDSAAFDKTSLGEQVLNSIIQASNVNPADFSRQAFNQEDILGDADILSLADTTKKTSAINQPESAIKSATPTKSIDQILSDMRQKTDLQSQVNQRFRDAGVNIPDVGNIGNINRADLADIIDGNIGIDPSIQARINEQSELDQAPSSSKIGFASNIDPRDETFRNMVESGDRGITEVIDTSPPPTDFEEQVGLPFSDSRMRDIERLLNVPEGQRRAGEGDDPNFFAGIPSAFNVFETIPREQMAIDVALGRPRGLGEMFRGVTAPNLQTETMKQFTDRLQRNIIGPEGDTTSFSAKNIPESQLIRDNRGRITAITDASGRTITGVNPDEPIGGGDDSDPIIKPLIIPKEEEKEDKPPNVIGGIDVKPTDPLPLVVDSPFAPATSKIEPISFDSGQLNKLIELLTGVPAKPVVSAAEGGLIRAVDDFLAIGR